MSREELDTIKQYLDSHLAKGFIYASLASVKGGSMYYETALAL